MLRRHHLLCIQQSVMHGVFQAHTHTHRMKSNQVGVCVCVCCADTTAYVCPLLYVCMSSPSAIPQFSGALRLINSSGAVGDVGEGGALHIHTIMAELRNEAL